MEPDDFLFERQDFSYEARYEPPATPWWDIRARWGLMSGAHRTNVVLYALGAVSLSLLLLELTAGENSPDLEAAGRVVPVASSTSTSRPLATTTTRPSSTTSSRPPSTTTAAATTATTRRSVTTVAQVTPVGAAEEPAPADPGPEPAPDPTDPPQQTPQPTEPPTPPPTSRVTTTQPPVTEPERPPVTLSPEHCQLLTQYGQTHPSCP